MVFLLFFQKSLFTENYFLIAAINLATPGPLYTSFCFGCNPRENICKSFLKFSFLLIIGLLKGSTTTKDIFRTLYPGVQCVLCLVLLGYTQGPDYTYGPDYEAFL